MKKKWIIIISIVVVAGVALFLILRSSRTTAPNYQTAEVTRGTIEATVTSTGTIVAVGTVQVGTQVSGTVEEVLVDYNDQVRKGQLLARLDTRVLQSSVDDARANVDRVQAQYAAALDQYRRNKPLYDKKYISAIEFNQYRSALDAAKASVTSAQVALQRARTNFGYAEIRSPTNGTVIQRAVEPGQTVAASLSTPTLFTIAQDLSQMQIEAQVDERDIGQIKEGQSAEFSVQSQGSKTFQGIVKQIRLQPQTVQNVVNYTVVVDARNPDKLLLPGMTATINFSVNRVADVLTVPNAALRFQPSAEVLEAMRAKSGQGDSATPRVRQTANRQGDSATGTKRTAAGGAQRSRGRLWILDEKGELRMILVRVGLSDGQRTEVSGPDVREGMKVITSSAQPQQSTTRPATGLPFGGGAGGTGGGGRRGGF
jgi:HlyD family secretion protein